MIKSKALYGARCLHFVLFLGLGTIVFIHVKIYLQL